MTDMQAPRYSIIFNGDLLDTISRASALEALSELTNTSPEELLDSLFSVKPVIITQTHDQQLAQQYERQFRAAGLKVVVEPYDKFHDEIINAELSFGHYAPLETLLTAPNFVIDTFEEPLSASGNQQQKNGKYRVIFHGQLVAGYDKRQVVENLCFLNNSSRQQVLENVFSAVPVIICQTDYIELARVYQQSFEQAGLKIQLSLAVVLPNLEIEARSRLLIRDDEPVPLPEKKVQRFTYTLYGLAGLALVLWVLITVIFDSFFDSANEQVLQVSLAPYLPVATVPTPAPEELPLPEEVPLPPLPEVSAAKPQPRTEQASKPKTRIEPASKPVAQSDVAPQPAPAAAATDNQSPQSISDDYYAQLLNWFAQYQQSQPLQSRFLEGEITLRVTILRSGKIKKVQVLSSSSEQLRRIIVLQVRAAAPIPAMPADISGSKYTFDMPLRYSLEKGP